MRICLHPVVLVVLVLAASAGSQAEAADRQIDRSAEMPLVEPARGESFVSVITQPSGGPILVVKYPWKRHAKPSVEVRVLDPSEVDKPLIRPLFFRHDIMKGDVTTAVYQCQDNSDELPQTATFSEGNADFEVFGARNSLGRPAVCVACRIVPEAAADETASLLADLARTGQETMLSMKFRPEMRAAYCLLDAWAVDRRTLYLELPASHFSQRSKIRVWLLRGKDIVWTANMTWPGAPE
jgi:hypothetical protein